MLVVAKLCKMYQPLIKTLSSRKRSVKKTKVSLIPPTCVAAINIEELTVHSALRVPIGCSGKNLPPLTGRIKSTLRNRLPDLKFFIIDEISVVSSNLLFYAYII